MWRRGKMAGKIPTFNEAEEDWDSYQDRLECYFKVNDVGNDLRVSVLITGLRASHYQVLKNLLSPDKPADKPYAAVIKVMNEHFGGKKNARVERAKFRSVVRLTDETVQSYAVRLKQAARYCEFGVNLDSNLVDQFTVGISSKGITDKILVKDLQLSFNEAVEIAVSAEAAEKSAAVYKRDTQVNAVGGTKYGAQKEPERFQTEVQSAETTFKGRTKVLQM